MAKLPEFYEQPTIALLSVGESAWTVPWAMWIDRTRGCWLHPNYSVHQTPGGTVTMQVHRTEQGYDVDISRCSHFRWSLGEPHYAGSHDDWLPVDNLRTETSPTTKKGA